MTSFEVDLLRVEIHAGRKALGEAAASAIGPALRVEAAMFAAAPSQSETLAALAAQDGVQWSRITAFHLDEYAGATAEAPYSFRRYLREHLLDKVAMASFEGIRAEAADLEGECRRYAEALAANPPGVALLGIGENGHLAFNDPPAARFEERAAVRVVELTEACRLQQVHDETFAELGAVPRAAISVSIPRIVEVPVLFVMVPGARKAQAVRDALEGPVSEACPASILRRHPNATLFLDEDSAALLSSKRRC